MKNKNDSRRKLLKSIAAGSGAVVAGKSLPESWSKPVVDAVLLPAHAETTDDSGSIGQGVTTTPAAAPTPTSTEPPCCLKAGAFCSKIGSPQGESGSINIEISAQGSVQVGVYVGDRSRYEGTGSIPCFGGEFTIRVDYVAIEMAPKEGAGEVALLPAGLVVTGTVICGQTTVSGTITGLLEPHNYTATPCF